MQSRSEILRMVRFVRRLIEGSALDHRPPAGRGRQERNWRRVPKVDVLPRRQIKLSSSLLIRGVLALVLVVGLFLALGKYRDSQDVDSALGAKTAQLQSIQQQLKAQQQAVEPLRNDISQLKLQLEGAEKAYGEVTAGYIEWHAAIEALLLNSETSGVRLGSLTAKPGGGVTVVGQATDPRTMATLPKLLRDISSTVEFQGIQWKPGSKPPEFTAAFKVRP